MESIPRVRRCAVDHVTYCVQRQAMQGYKDAQLPSTGRSFWSTGWESNRISMEYYNYAPGVQPCDSKVIGE